MSAPLRRPRFFGNLKSILSTAIENRSAVPSSKSQLALILSVLIILGFIDAWAGRQSYVAGDTVSYMDIARHIAGGDLQHAVNGHWSPLYPAVLAVFIGPFQSNSLLEFSVVRGVNFLIFLATIAL